MISRSTGTRLIGYYCRFHFGVNFNGVVILAGVRTRLHMMRCNVGGMVQEYDTNFHQHILTLIIVPLPSSSCCCSSTFGSVCIYFHTIPCTFVPFYNYIHILFSSHVRATLNIHASTTSDDNSFTVTPLFTAE